MNSKKKKKTDLIYVKKITLGMNSVKKKLNLRISCFKKKSL
jgi:hypothetical protein